MTINEIFERPTVQKVIFQILFPNMFYLESRMGEYQESIMDEFPESRLLVQSGFPIVQSELSSNDINPDEPSISKIWQFVSSKGVTLNVKNGSLDLSSKLHKSYENSEAEYRFRDAIKLAVDSFLRITRIQSISRIGLRYIDDCPLLDASNEELSRCYNTSLNIDRFNLSLAQEMSHIVTIRKGEYFLRFAESFSLHDNEPTLTIDIDAYSNDVSQESYLSVTDHLHSLISDEYKSSLREPVFRYMRGEEL